VGYSPKRPKKRKISFVFIREELQLAGARQNPLRGLGFNVKNKTIENPRK
jgi:hypothetical protein